MGRNRPHPFLFFTFPRLIPPKPGWNRKDARMKKSSLLSQLAIAGIAAGLVSVAPVRAADATGDTTKAAAPAKKKHKSKKQKKAMADSSAKASATGDSTMGKSVAASQAAKHDCKGQNSCKGLGGCKTSQDELQARAQKAGISMDKAGSAHSCKGQNACKGLGGCKST